MHRWRNSEKSFTSNTLARIMECPFGFIPTKKTVYISTFSRWGRPWRTSRMWTFTWGATSTTCWWTSWRSIQSCLRLDQRSERCRSNVWCLWRNSALCEARKNRLCDIPSGHNPDQRILITWLADIRIQSANQMIRWLFSVRKMMMIIAHWFLSNASQLW